MWILSADVLLKNYTENAYMLCLCVYTRVHVHACVYASVCADRQRKYHAENYNRRYKRKSWREW